MSFSLGSCRCNPACPCFWCPLPPSPRNTRDWVLYKGRVIYLSPSGLSPGLREENDVIDVHILRALCSEGRKYIQPVAQPISATLLGRMALQGQGGGQASEWKGILLSPGQAQMIPCLLPPPRPPYEIRGCEEKGQREITARCLPRGDRCSCLLPGLTGPATLLLTLILFSEKETEALREAITHPSSHSWHSAAAGLARVSSPLPIRLFRVCGASFKGRTPEKHQCTKWTKPCCSNGLC